MARHSLDRWLLVNYAGYPYAPNSLMPDNGLANLAGALLADGREVEILDYGTVDILRRLADPALHPRLVAAWRRLRPPQPSLWARVQQGAALLALRRCESQRTRWQARVVAEIAGEVVERVRARGIQAVGFKLWNGDGIEGSATIADALRRACPGVRLFAGGPQVDMFADLVPEVYPAFDACVYGDGEETIVALAAEGDHPAAWAALPNLVYRDGGAVRTTPACHVADLNSLPMPAYAPDIYPAMRGSNKIKIIVVDESRGCRNQCAFCIHPVKSDRHLRVKSVPRLLAELDLFGRDPGVHTFRFAGSCTPYALLNDFAAAVLQSGRRVAYASFAHVRDSAEADFARLQRSGCEALFFGIESGSQRVLDRMRKGTTVAGIADTLQRARAAGLFTVGSLIVPAPGDDAASQAETLALLAAAPPDALTLQAPIVTPRTDWYEHPERYGIHFPDREAYRRQGLLWKAKLLLPPTLWADVAVHIDGRSNREIRRATQAFSRRLAALGLPTGISDDLCLMSRRTGQDPVAFRDEAIQAFFTGDADGVAALVERVNAAV